MEFLLSFLPYLETPDGTPIEVVLGRKLTYWQGTEEEVFETEIGAKERLKLLIDKGAIERAEIRQYVPVYAFVGKLICIWPER